jgi:hypothetical protein
LGAFDSPGGIDQQDVEFTDFLDKEIPVEVFDITIDESIVY